MAHSADNVFSNPFGDVSYMSSNQNKVAVSGESIISVGLAKASSITLEKLENEELPSEEEAKSNALLVDQEISPETKTGGRGQEHDDSIDQIFSFRAEFSGFVVSFVDSAPSEIAVASLRNLNALARWNAHRTSDASVIVSIGWLQVDNHVPSAPFKVAVRPDSKIKQDNEKDTGGELDSEKQGMDATPLLVVALAFAPRHSSGIVVSFGWLSSFI